MADKGYYGTELTLPSYLHALLKRIIKPVFLAPVDPHREDSSEQDERSDSTPPTHQGTQRRPSPHQNVGRNVIAPPQAEVGPEEQKFKRTKDRRPSPHPNQIHTDRVNVGGKRSPDFKTPEAVIQTGAVGGSVTNVDVHPHGEVKQAMEDHNKEQREGELLYEGNALERTLSRIKNYIWRRGPKPIPDTLAPIDDSFAKSASHPSLATDSLGLPGINYSVSDSEISSQTQKAVVHRPPSSPSEESEDPNRRAASAPEAVKDTESEKTGSEDPRGRRATSAAAVLETSRQSDHSDSEDDDDDEDSKSEFLQHGGSDQVSVGGRDSTGEKSNTPQTKSKSSEDISRIKTSKEVGSPSSQDVPFSSSTPPPGTSGLPLITVTPEPELQSSQDPTTSTPRSDSELQDNIRSLLLKPGFDGLEQVPGPSKSAHLRVPSPGPSKSMYKIQTTGPLEISVSQENNTVTTCITFETTPPSSSDEECSSSGESSSDEE